MADGEARPRGVYAQIKEEILSGALAPGYLAPETELAERFGASRTPVREAVIRLEGEGLVEVVPRRGIRVLPVKPSDMREIYEILAALESLAAGEVAARQPGAEALRNLEEAAEEMEAALEAGDLNRWALGDDRFHQEVLRLHGNERLIAITASLLNQAHRAQMVTLRMRRPPHQSNQEHRAILEHIRAGDSEKARLAFLKHRRRGGQEMLDILEGYGLPPL